MSLNTIETQDKLEYTWLPAGSSSFVFRVRAPNDAHIALTSSKYESNPMLEVFLGGWSNSKSVIRRNRSQPDVVEQPTPQILNAGQFLGFWIRWTDNVLTVGREGDAAAFMSYNISESFPINFIGVCTGWGASGSWTIDSPQVAPAMTVGGSAYAPSFSHPNLQNFYPHQPSAPMMGFVAPNLLQNHLIGSGQTNVNPGYVPAMAQFSYPSGNLQNELATTRIVQQSFTPAPAGSVSFQPPYAPQAGFPGAQPSFQPNLYATQSFSPSYNQGPQYSWVESDANSIPQRAFAGGRDLDGETLYVGRADHRGALTPGKVNFSHGACYIGWGGEEHKKTYFEVLEGTGMQWVRGDHSIPSNAIEGGRTEDGEILYIGRVSYNGTMTVGKVQESHGVCYIPFGGEEMRFNNFEVLTA